MLAALAVLRLQAASLKDPEIDRLTNELSKAQTQTDLNIASGRIARYWDGRLDAVEKRIDTKLTRKELKEFAESKTRWRQYREQEVKFRAGFFEGGSIQPLIANSHYSGMTEHRVAELEAFFTDALDH